MLPVSDWLAWALTMNRGIQSLDLKQDLVDLKRENECSIYKNLAGGTGVYLAVYGHTK